MSDFDDFLKAVAEAKQKDPIAQKVSEVKENLKFDLGDLFSQISVIKEQDPVQQKNKQIEKQVQESVKMDLSSLFSQLSNLKNDLEEELVVAEAKLVETQQEDAIVEDMLSEVTPVPVVIKTPKQRIKDTNADVDKYLTGKTFQQPNPDLVSKDVEAIRTKIKFLEQAIGRIAAAGPGGGEVNLRFLDDVDRSTIADGLYLRYSATKKKFEFAAVSGGGVSQIQSDWNQTNTASLDFIKNKPSIKGIIIADTAPSNGASGDLWWNSSNGNLYIFYDNFWVIANLAGTSTIIRSTVLVTTATYTINTSDWYVGVNRSGVVSITLPTGLNGQEIIIKDESGNCETYPITIIGTVDNDAGGFIIQINNGGVQLVYRNGWRIV